MGSAPGKGPGARILNGSPSDRLTTADLPRERRCYRGRRKQMRVFRRGQCTLFKEPGVRSGCYGGCQKFCSVWGEKKNHSDTLCVLSNRKLPWRGNLPDPSPQKHLLLWPGCGAAPQRSVTIWPFHVSPCGEGGRRVTGRSK